MSFGASPSDIIIVVKFCKSLYRKCKNAGGEYDEISREVRGLHTVLRHLNYEVDAPESPLNRDSSIWGRQLAPIIGDCDSTLRQLDALITKYGRLANDSGDSPSSPRVMWERMKFGSNEMDQLGGLRVKLISHKTSLSLFLDTIQLHQSGKMVETLDNQSGQLDVILDKVDKIATKMQEKGGSVLTNYDDDDREVWKQFRRELVAEGFSSDVLQQHKDVLRAYIREIDTQGLLEPVSVDPHVAAPPAANPQTERWLENVKSPSVQSSTLVATEDGPPSFESLDTPTDELSAKTMMIQEENMKFPQSMKNERPKPESRHNSTRQLDVPLEKSSNEKISSGLVQRQPSPVPKLVTSSADEKDAVYLNTDGSSESDTTDTSSVPSQSPTYGQIITTTNLLALSQALTLRPPSPNSSFNSQKSYLEDAATRSMAYRPKRIETGASPQQPGAIPIPSPSNKPGDRLGNIPQNPDRLAPDAQGKEIPADAKWTKINRRLVSPEVLDQAHKRYEARPDFVAVLGVLSRAEIQDLAARSHTLREARRRRHFPPEIPPPQPPRHGSSPNHSFNSHSLNSHPSVARSIPNTRTRGGRDTPSSESYSSSDSDSSSRRSRKRAVKPKGILKTNSGYQWSGQPGYSGSYQGPPSPVWSPTSVERDRMFREPDRVSKRRDDDGSAKRRDGDRAVVKKRDGDRKDYGHHGHSHGGSHHGHGHHRSERDRERGEREREREGREREREREREGRERERERERGERDREGRERDKERGETNQRRRWKDNLTAAGIGGAAASLINVLTEAAEGL